jgi:sugar phosphate isomerase/epimerase
MKLAFSTNAFKQVSLEESLREIAGCGYAGVEIMADVPHAYPPHMDPKRRRAVLDLLKSLRLTVTNLNAFTLFAQGDTWHPSWIEPEAEARERRYEHTRQAIRLARDLGAPGISLEPGGPLPAGMTRRAAMDLYKAGLEKMLPLAEECTVDLLVEPEPHLLIERPEEYEEMLGILKHPRLALNFDIGHFYCVGVDPAEAVRRLAPHIRHVHLEDIAPSREHKHLVPGRGAIDYRSVLRALDDVGYRGWITVELYPYEAQATEVAGEAFKVLAEFF